MNMRRIADHDDYRITYHHTGSPTKQTVVVTFGGQPSGISDAGFGTLFAEKLGIDSIFVAQKNGSQYQGLSIEQFESVISPEIIGKDVVCYGSSLGAYAALYYGGCINSRIIAAAPMFPAWRPMKNRVYADLPIAHKELWEVPKSDHVPVVIFDPKSERDAFIIREMVDKAYPVSRKILVPYSGHTVLVTLSQLGSISKLISGLVETDTIVDFEIPREGHAIYHRERARELVRTDKEAAKEELRKSLAISPSRQAFNILFNLYLRSGEYDLAQDMIRQANASESVQVKLVPFMVEAARKAGLALS